MNVNQPLVIYFQGVSLHVSKNDNSSVFFKGRSLFKPRDNTLHVPAASKQGVPGAQLVISNDAEQERVRKERMFEN